MRRIFAWLAIALAVLTFVTNFRSNFVGGLMALLLLGGLGWWLLASTTKSDEAKRQQVPQPNDSPPNQMRALSPDPSPAADDRAPFGVAIPPLPAWHAVPLAPSRPEPAAGNPTGAHSATPPSGDPTDPWIAGRPETNVVGEAYRDDSFARIVAMYPSAKRDEPLILREALLSLACDPHNPFDPHAVSVWYRRIHVGYLPREIAVSYAAPLAEVEAGGGHLVVGGSLWIIKSTYDNRYRANVRVALPPVNGVYPFNAMPDDPHVVLPPGRAIQVIGEEKHMDVLTTYLAHEGERYLAFTLHPHLLPAKTSRATERTVVEVRLDDQPIGQLSPKMSEDTLDLIRFVHQQGLLPVCRGTLKGSSIRADVTLHVARSNEVPQTWLDQHRK